jgi:hypothetical protein
MYYTCSANLRDPLVQSPQPETIRTQELQHARYEHSIVVASVYKRLRRNLSENVNKFID